jgi:hypothetical protein
MSLTPTTRRLSALAVIVAMAAVGLALAGPRMRVNRGVFHHLQREHEEAVEILSRCDLGPPDFTPIRYLVASHLALGNDAEAQAVLDQVLREHPDWRSCVTAIGNRPRRALAVPRRLLRESVRSARLE